MIADLIFMIAIFAAIVFGLANLAGRGQRVPEKAEPLRRSSFIPVETTAPAPRSTRPRHERAARPRSRAGERRDIAQAARGSRELIEHRLPERSEALDVAARSEWARRAVVAMAVLEPCPGRGGALEERRSRLERARN